MATRPRPISLDFPAFSGKPADYMDWRFYMVRVLRSMKTWPVVNGESTKPEAANDENGTLGEAWDEKDADAQLAICAKLSKDALIYVRDDSLDTAKKMWDALETQFQGKTVQNKVNISEKLYTMKLHEGGDLAAHIADMTKLIQQYRSCGESFDDASAARRLIGSLPGSYDAIKAALLVRVKDLTWSEAVESVREFGDMQQKSGSKGSAGAMGAQKKPWKANQTSGKPSGKGKGPKCFECGRYGHIARNCRDRGKDAGSSHKGKNSRAGSSSFAMSAGTGKTGWLVDSGASDHMTNNRSSLTDYKAYSKSGTVTLGDDSKIPSDGYGSMQMDVSCGGERSELSLSKVLYVPDLGKNLMSVSQMAKFGATVEFTDKFVTISKDGQCLPIGRPQGDVYVVDLVNAAKSRVHSAGADLSLSELWHRRLGHLNGQYMRKLVQGGYLNGKGVNGQMSKFDDCYGCAAGKLHRLPFPCSENRSDVPLGLVHSDICGPMPVPSIGGSVYFVTFVDDHSRHVEVQFLHRKSEALTAFKEFLAYSEKLTGRKVKCLRTDGGGEYTSQALEDYCKSRGIDRQQTVAYTPEQNGVAERMNRTLVETARSMMCQAGLPVQFWAEAVCTASYLRNRSPTSALDGGVPLESYLDHSPKLGNLRVFGCDVFYHVPKVKRQKFDPKAEKGVFIGYSRRTKGFRIYNPDTDEVQLSRDVKFLENSFDVAKRMGSNNHDADENGAPLQLEYPEVEQRADVEQQDSDPGADADPGGQAAPPAVPVVQAPPAVPNLQQQGQVLAQDEDDGEQQLQPLLPRRSTRNKKPSEHRVKTYHYNAEAYQDVSSDDDEEPGNAACAVGFYSDDVVEPRTLKQALKGPQADLWKQALDSEHNSLLENGTWELVDIPKDKNIVGSKWTFKIKRNSDGSIDRYKCRLVAQGFSQRYGMDYDEVYAPVVRYNSVRTILSIANQMDLELHQMDVTTAFLNGRLTEEIYMKQPAGYATIPGKVCRLKRSIYGLKQSARLWNFEIDGYLKSAGYEQSQADSCVYTKSGLPKGKIMIIAIYVDDLLFATNDTKLLEAEKAALGQAFKMVDKGEAHYILGMSIVRDRKKRTLKLGQRMYLQGVLKKFGMQDSKPVKIPMDRGSKFEAATEETGGDEEFKRTYQAAIGCLTYAATATRPDLSVAVNMLSQFAANPSHEHWMAVKRVLRYISGTTADGLVFTADDSKEVVLSGYTDADWAGDVATRKSTSGYLFRVSGGTVSWRSQRQPVVALSSTEAEYIATTVACKELVWLRRLLGDLGFQQTGPTVLYADNQGAILLSRNPACHDRTKHIDIRYHYIRERTTAGEVDLHYCATDSMLADPLTKAGAFPQIQSFRRKAGVG